MDNQIDKNLARQYEETQANLKWTLQSQIKRLLPLQYDYTDLQNYHMHISSQFQSLLEQQDSNIQNNSEQIYQMLNLTEELDNARNHLLQEIKHVQASKAQKILQRKNYVSECQALAQKYQLEKIELICQNEKYHETLEQTDLIQKNIRKLRDNLKRVQLEAQQKEKQNAIIQQKLKLAEDEKNRLEDEKVVKQQRIKGFDQGNQDFFKRIQCLQQQLEQLLGKIQICRKQQIQLNECNIQKRKNIQNYKNQKDYLQQLIQAQQKVLFQTTKKQKNLQSIVEERQEQLSKIKNANKQIQDKIREEQQKCNQNKNYIEKSKEYLSELVKSNRLLLQQLNRSCQQDLKVFKVLQNKIFKNSKLNQKFGAGISENMNLLNLESTYKNERISTTIRQNKAQKMQQSRQETKQSWFNSTADKAFKRSLYSALMENLKN